MGNSLNWILGVVGNVSQNGGNGVAAEVEIVASEHVAFHGEIGVHHYMADPHANGYVPPNDFGVEGDIRYHHAHGVDAVTPKVGITFRVLPKTALTPVATVAVGIAVGNHYTRSKYEYNASLGTGPRLQYDSTEDGLASSAASLAVGAEYRHSAIALQLKLGGEIVGETVGPTASFGVGVVAR